MADNAKLTDTDLMWIIAFLSSMLLDKQLNYKLTQNEQNNLSMLFNVGKEL